MTWNLNNTTDTQPNNFKKDYKKIEYLKQPGAYKVTINSQTDQDDREDYNGSPYIEFSLYTIDGKKTRARFWAPREGDSEKASEFKSKLLKEFMLSAGVKSFDNMDEALKECIGKTINVCMTTREYITTDRDTGEPIVRTALDYKFSKKAGENIKYDAKYNKTLTPEQRQTFNTLLDEYTGSPAVSNQSDDDDNLPF
mgnify:FL=1